MSNEKKPGWFRYYGIILHRSTQFYVAFILTGVELPFLVHLQVTAKLAKATRLNLGAPDGFWLKCRELSCFSLIFFEYSEVI